MYYTHNLRANLEKWQERVCTSSYQSFENSFNFFFSKLDSVPLFKSILLESVEEYTSDESKLGEYYEAVFDGAESFYYENEREAAATCFQFLKYLKEVKKHTWHAVITNVATDTSHNAMLERFNENYINPITQYIYDQIDDASFTLYLLEKYKLRVEWFKRGELLKRYKDNTAESLLEDDLRLFLFDQGVDYPFSTPKSASGRADVIDLSNPDDPLVLEVKIYDTERQYKKNRIADGFSQIVTYSNDYNKSVGYLVVFNVDNVEIEIVGDSPKTQPKSVLFNHKTYFIIVINLNQDETASKKGKLEVVRISENELTKKITEVES